MFPQNKIRLFYLLIDILFIFLSFSLVYFFRYNSAFFSSMDFGRVMLPYLREHVVIFFLWGGLLVATLKNKNLYTTTRDLTIPREMYLVLTSLITISVIIAAVIFFAQLKFFSRAFFFFSLIFLCISLTSWRVVKRLILRYLVKRGFHNFNVLIVGTSKVAKLLIQEIHRRPYLGFNIVGILGEHTDSNNWPIPYLGGLSDFEDVCRKYFIDEVFITEPSEQNGISKVTGLAKRMRLGVRIVPADFEAAHRLIELNYLGFVPILTYEERDLRSSELFTKRFFDFMLALTLLVTLSPVLLVIALFIKIDSPGPVFYTQKRMGKKGNIFNIYKFRSMREGAETLKSDLLGKNEMKGGIIFKLKNDPRITRVGRFLRRYSLDELPQLVNVLEGNMSLVGPRPFPVEESRKFELQHLPRLRTKPGITGLAQIRGRSDISFSRWVRWDLWYIKNWSFLLDVKILWHTLPMIFKGKGAY